MKVVEFKTENNQDKKRVAATVIWENCNRPTQDVYFETVEPFTEDLSCNPDAFLVACAIPAMHYGEKRILIDAEICPELLIGIETAMGWMRHWYNNPNREPLRIEAKARSGLLTSQASNRAGLFFSGGIDSLSTLRTNRLRFPLEHPWSIKDGIIVYGLELDDPQKFEYVMDSLSYLAQELGVTLVPVYTNIYLNYREEDRKTRFSFWYYKFMGASLAAVAHAFARRLSVATITADYDIPNQKPHGSHPLLDPNYSSADLRIRHDGTNLSRYEKTRLVAGWDVALQNLRVCNQYKTYQKGMLNCGKCEKCVRTMLTLLALGMLDKTKAFPINNITKELIQSAVKLKFDSIPFYKELISPLRKKGFYEFIPIIERKITNYHKDQKFRNLKLKIKKLTKIKS